MRALFRPLALHAAYTPIETIVFFCIVGTLAYFYILSAIKHSAFLDPSRTVYAQPTLRPTHAFYQQGEWVGVRESTYYHAVKGKAATALEVQQLVYTLEPKAKSETSYELLTLSLSQPPLSTSTANLTKHLTTSFSSPLGRTYSSLCFRPVVASGNDSADGLDRKVQHGPCFVSQQTGQHKFIHTLSFRPGMRDEWVAELTGEQSSHHAHGTSKALPKVFTDEAGVRFEVDTGKNGPESLPLTQMKNGKWVAYAARALVMRFWDLAKKADSLDIVLILAGYILMHTTFYLLFTRSRKLGSSFWLPLAIMSSAVLALLISIPVAVMLRIPIDPVALTEALPFLVCTVGFDKPLRLARAVFLHPHLTVPPALVPGASSGYPTASTESPATLPVPLASAQQLKPAPKIITDSLSLVYAPIIRDYILEIAVLTIGAYSKVSGLKEVCALAAIILAIDCLLLCTYLSAILGIMVEVRRIKTVRAMTRSRSNSISSISSSSSSTVQPRHSAMAKRPAAPQPPTLRQRVQSILLGGEKGSGLPTYEECVGAKSTKGSIGATKATKEKPENPVARLKLLLIATFLTLHIANLITPLAPSRHNLASSSHLNVRKVDITAPGIRSVLQSIAEASSTQRGSSSFDDEESAPEHDLFVKVSPPIYVRVTPPASLVSSNKVVEVRQGAKSTSEHLEAFMSSWTRLVGDPILSKWIIIVLAISITLNGYLLKGIAAGVVGHRVTSLVGKAGGVRFEEGADREEVVEEEKSASAPAPIIVQHAQVVLPAEKLKEVIIPAPELAPVAPPKAPSSPDVTTKVGTFTLEDVDRKLKVTAKANRRLTVTAASLNKAYSSSSESSSASADEADVEDSTTPEPVRSLEECIDIFDNGPRPLSASLALLSDEEVILLATNGKIAAYALEKVLGMNELERAVRIRRALISRASRTQTLETSEIPISHYDYSRVLGACCENVIGYIPLPLGIAGPLNVDGTSYHIPMATAEGTLVASTSRGCKALNAGGGVITVLTADGMTRGPAIDFPSVVMAADAKAWIDTTDGYETIKQAFESTSRFAKLKSLKTALAGRTLFVRFATATGDAMGMNMISKGTEKALEALQKQYPEMVILALSGNYCTDKKPAAINWIEGRGKSVVAEAIIPGKIVRTVLKTTVEALCNLNVKKNLIGSAMAGSIGGFNAHAANILTAIFLATGQDPAQNVESSMCMTLMEPINGGEDLLMSVNMPCIEVGTVGGGTVLAPQQAVLELLGIKGAHPTHPGQNSQRLARIIAAAVMAGELSLLSALAAGHLIRAHMAHNRSQTNTPAASVPATPAPRSPPVVAGQLPTKPEEEKGGAIVPLTGPLTPSSSTASLPPYSQ